MLLAFCWKSKRALPLLRHKDWHNPLGYLPPIPSRWANQRSLCSRLWHNLAGWTSLIVNREKIIILQRQWPMAKCAQCALLILMTQKIILFGQHNLFPPPWSFVMEVDTSWSTSVSSWTLKLSAMIEFKTFESLSMRQNWFFKTVRWVNKRHKITLKVFRQNSNLWLSTILENHCLQIKETKV